MSVCESNKSKLKNFLKNFLKKLKNVKILEKLEKCFQETWRIVVKEDVSHEEPCLDTVIKIQCLSRVHQRCNTIWKSS